MGHPIAILFRCGADALHSWLGYDGQNQPIWFPAWRPRPYDDPALQSEAVAEALRQSREGSVVDDQGDAPETDVTQPASSSSGVFTEPLPLKQPPSTPPNPTAAPVYYHEWQQPSSLPPPYAAPSPPAMAHGLLVKTPPQAPPASSSAPETDAPPVGAASANTSAISAALQRRAAD